VVVTDKGGEIYTVTNPDTVADHQGHHVKVDGELDESAKIITVAKGRNAEVRPGFQSSPTYGSLLSGP